MRTVRLVIAACAMTVMLASAARAGQITINPSGFVATVDNPYYPLVPGTTFVYEAQINSDFKHVEVIVTCDTRLILGVSCTDVFDRVWINGVLEESTHDWFAQDTSGNVWYFGEATQTLNADGSVAGTTGSWEGGVNGAVPGIIMLADPRPGLWYRQEYLPGVAEDMGKVLRLTAPVSVPEGNFAACVETKEWTRLSPGDVEHKYYARGTGQVLTTELHGGPTVFEELVDVRFAPCR